MDLRALFQLTNKTYQLVSKTQKLVGSLVILVIPDAIKFESYDVSILVLNF